MNSVLGQFRQLAMEYLEYALRGQAHGFSNVSDTLAELCQGVNKCPNMTEHPMKWDRTGLSALQAQVTYGMPSRVTAFTTTDHRAQQKGPGL